MFLRYACFLIDMDKVIEIDSTVESPLDKVLTKDTPLVIEMSKDTIHSSLVIDDEESTTASETIEDIPLVLATNQESSVVDKNLTINRVITADCLIITPDKLVLTNNEITSTSKVSNIPLALTNSKVIDDCTLEEEKHMISTETSSLPVADQHIKENVDDPSENKDQTMENNLLPADTLSDVDVPFVLCNELPTSSCLPNNIVSPVSHLKLSIIEDSKSDNVLVSRDKILTATVEQSARRLETAKEDVIVQALASKLLEISKMDSRSGVRMLLQASEMKMHTELNLVKTEYSVTSPQFQGTITLRGFQNFKLVDPQGAVFARFKRKTTCFWPELTVSLGDDPPLQVSLKGLLSRSILVKEGGRPVLRMKRPLVAFGWAPEYPLIGTDNTPIGVVNKRYRGYRIQCPQDLGVRYKTALLALCLFDHIQQKS